MYVVNRMKAGSWLLLLYGLPTGQKAERVSFWRKLKLSGAIQLRNSAYLLPDKPEHFERLQWLAQQIRDAGGEATLIRVNKVEGLPDEEIMRLFNDARAKEYEELMQEINQALAKAKEKEQPVKIAAEREKWMARFEKIQQIDFFNCARAQDAQMLLNRASGLREESAQTLKRLSAKQYTGKTWLTRARPEIDRVASAWLIRRHIDPKARFIFSPSTKAFPDAIGFDILDGEFSHHGEDCTFEFLTQRFGIRDKTILQIAQMVHEADLEDGKYPRKECVGIDRVLKGWARLGVSDEQLIEKGMECFDALYEFLKK